MSSWLDEAWTELDGETSAPFEIRVVGRVPGTGRGQSEAVLARALASRQRRVDIFWFSFGSVVIWGLPSAQYERQIALQLSQLEPERIDPSQTVAPLCSAPLEALEFDDMEFCYSAPSSSALGSHLESIAAGRAIEEPVHGGPPHAGAAAVEAAVAAEAAAGAAVVALPSGRPRVGADTVLLEGDDPLEKLAVSYACAQSNSLAVLEDRVDASIEDMGDVPEVMQRTGYVPLTDHDISRRIGQLFVDRKAVNLTSDLLDTPEFLWEYDEYEATYQRVRRYLEIDHRVAIVNRRLDVIKELLEMMSAQLDNQHATKLEWIVIWLIVAEVVLELFLGLVSIFAGQVMP